MFKEMLTQVIVTKASVHTNAVKMLNELRLK